MAISWKLTGGVDNTDPNASFGGYRATGEISATPKNNLFDDITPDEATTGEVAYRALSLYATGEGYSDVKVYMDPETTSSDSQIDMAYGGLDVGDGTSITGELEAPDQTGWVESSGFTHRNSGSKLEIDGLSGEADNGEGQEARIWFKRTIDAAAAAQLNDIGTIVVEYIQYT